MSTEATKLAEEVLELEALLVNSEQGSFNWRSSIARQAEIAPILASALLEAEKEIEQLRELYRARTNYKLADELAEAQKHIADYEHKERVYDEAVTLVESQDDPVYQRAFIYDTLLERDALEKRVAELEGRTKVCKHEDCPYPVSDSDRDCGNHEPRMT